MTTLRKRLLVAAAAVLTALAITAAFYLWGPRRTPAGQPPLAVLSPLSLPGFVQSFNEASERYRIITLLSPT